jgi:UDP-N-acetylglucosamine 2-epimerase (non-hydrolysing)
LKENRKLERGVARATDYLRLLDFSQLMSNAKLVLTDSGGIQEETTILGIPCVTIRENTERPITVTHGTNVIAGVKKENIINAAFAQLRKFSEASSVSPPPFWDGRAAERIVEILAKQAEIRNQNKE